MISKRPHEFIKAQLKKAIRNNGAEGGICAGHFGLVSAIAGTA